MQVAPYELGGEIPAFKMEDRKYLNDIKDSKGNYVVSVKLEDYAVC